MNETGLKKIGVIGIGVMGNGIAQVAAQNGFETVVMDIDEEVLEDELGSFYKPNPLLKRLAESGQFGAKTGSGFYIWEKFKASGVNPDIARFRIG